MESPPMQNKDDEYYQKLLNAATCSKKMKTTMLTLGAFVRHEQPDLNVGLRFKRGYEEEPEEEPFPGRRQGGPFPGRRQGNCETSNGRQGTIVFKNFLSPNKTTAKTYIDYGNEITFPNGVKYINRCFILSLAHVLRIDVCNFYGNIIKILNANKILPGQSDYLSGMNEEQFHEFLNTLPADEDGPRRAAVTQSTEYFQYIDAKRQILSNGRGGPQDYIDGKLFLTYFKFGNLLPHGLIILTANNKEPHEFDTNGPINRGEYADGIYINPTGNINGRPTLDTPIIYNWRGSHFVVGNPLKDQGILDSIIAHTINMTEGNNNAPFNYPELVAAMQQQAGSRNRKTRKLKKTRKSKNKKNNRKTRRRR